MKRIKLTTERISLLIASASLVISMISFVFTTFPQINPLNDNLVEKANAGDTDSQMILANLYYEIGNIGESVQWYTVAASRGGSHQAKAINNLAVIYLTDNRFDVTRQENEFDAMKMLRAASEMGEIKATKNLYLLLISNPKEIFGDCYSEFLEYAEEELKDNDISLDSLEQYYTEWELIETVTEEFVPNEDGEYKIVPVQKIVKPQNGYPVIVNSYNVYRKIDGAEIPNYFYIKIV